MPGWLFFDQSGKPGGMSLALGVLVVRVWFDYFCGQCIDESLRFMFSGRFAEQCACF